MHTDAHAHGDHGGAADEAGFHGMALWGTDNIYLSHLPMFGPLYIGSR